MEKETNYLKHRKDACEECGARNMQRVAGSDYWIKRKILTVHHIDGNPANNDPSNLQTLCRKCHDKKHGVNLLT